MSLLGSQLNDLCLFVVLHDKLNGSIFREKSDTDYRISETKEDELILGSREIALKCSLVQISN